MIPGGIQPSKLKRSTVRTESVKLAPSTPTASLLREQSKKKSGSCSNGKPKPSATSWEKRALLGASIRTISNTSSRKIDGLHGARTARLRDSLEQAWIM